MTRAGCDADGFVLIAVLWFVALLALVSAIVFGWISSAVDQASALHGRVAARIAMIDLTSRLEFDLVSGYFTPDGLALLDDAEAARAAASPLGLAALAEPPPVVALDGRAYRAADSGIAVRLQDEAGLWNLNEGDGFLLRRMLAAYGVGGHDRRDPLLARLHDYTTRPQQNGGEGGGGGAAEDDDAMDRADYARAGLPPPRHAPLLTPWETYRILGWDREAALWHGAAALPEMTAIGRFAGVNVNTAPAAVLATIPGLDDAAVARLVAARQRRPIADPLAMEQATGVVAAVAGQDVTFLPSNSVRLDLLPPAGEGDMLRHTLLIRLTPLGTAPYRVDYTIDLPRNATEQALTSPPDLPAPPGPASDAAVE